MADTQPQIPENVSEEEIDRILAQHPEIPPDLREDLRRDWKLQREMSEYFKNIYDRMQAGEPAPSWDEIQNHLNEVARTKYGIEYGVTLPPINDIHRKMILGRGVPLRHLVNDDRTEFEGELLRQNINLRTRNSWNMLGDQTIVVIETEEGPMALPRYHAGTRLRKMMDAMDLRFNSQQTAEAEFRAMDSLKKRINNNQWESYVLNGIFPELSKRSDIHYFFRKGYPTLATSFHSGVKDNSQGRVLAALCLHPMGYYDGSHVGVMCPTDEVICALLMMRGDEYGFWKNSGQWSAVDPRSGL